MTVLAITKLLWARVILVGPAVNALHDRVFAAHRHPLGRAGFDWTLGDVQFLLQREALLDHNHLFKDHGDHLGRLLSGMASAARVL
jgi:hypothetical protein